jgi:DNA polymerase/3'-5' exonuclease PolX
MRHDSALKVAESLVEYFRPACARIEIKGSLARCKPEVKDIDLLVIPDLTPLPRPRLEFGKPAPAVYKTALDKMIADMVADGAIQMTKTGERSKTFLVKYAGIICEIYTVLPPATWGVRSVIRTGPADFSHWIVTHHRRGGAMPDGFRVQDGAVWEGDQEQDITGKTPLGFDEERDFLDWLQLGWIEPGFRVAGWRR